MIIGEDGEVLMLDTGLVDLSIFRWMLWSLKCEPAS